jgi:hypothetical protein
MIFDEENGCISDQADAMTRKISCATMGFVVLEIERKLDTSNPEVAAILSLIEQMKGDTIAGLDDASGVKNGFAFH